MFIGGKNFSRVGAIHHSHLFYFDPPLLHPLFSKVGLTYIKIKMTKWVAQIKTIQKAVGTIRVVFFSFKRK
jgi:hypothetical protein